MELKSDKEPACNSALNCLLPQQKIYHRRQCQLLQGGLFAFVHSLAGHPSGARVSARENADHSAALHEDSNFSEIICYASA